ncbi:MAG: hypothetical protein AB8F74_23240 [Saprospiraceae bacterium]
MNQNNPAPYPIPAGTRINETIVKESRAFGDLIVVWSESGKVLALTKESATTKSPKTYKVNHRLVTDVRIVKQHEILILTTSEGRHFRNFQLQKIEDQGNWADHYVEPHHQQLYRMDLQGNWFDIEGRKLEAPVFIQGSVLSSLLGKCSKQSLSFRGQTLLISPSRSLIQVGKLVYDIRLEPVAYYGQKITGLGFHNITLTKDKNIQEVYLGLNQKAYLIEKELAPFLILGEPVTDYLRSVQKGGHRYEIFKTKQNTYVIKTNSGDVVTCNEEPVYVNFSTYVKMNGAQLVLCSNANGSRYMNLKTEESFHLPQISDEAITEIDASPMTFNEAQLRNMESETKVFVYNESVQEIFTLNDESITPEHIRKDQNYPNHYGIATILGTEKLFYKKKNELVKIPNTDFEIAQILSPPDQKLLNAVTTTGERIVLDARKGYDQLQQAFSGERAVVEVLGTAKKLGYTIVQNVLLETLGGSEKRVIDLNKEHLDIFTLPDDLYLSTEQTNYSTFRNNPLVNLDFEKIIEVESEQFIKGMFVPFHESPLPVLIQMSNGQPLHLEGGGFRNELVFGFNQSTLNEKYFLGPHRMVGALTYTEDLKEREVLFSFLTKRSWLMMGDSYLPIFRKVVKHNSEKSWDYLLFELRRIASQKEYVVVEKKEPHRILVMTENDLEIPKVLSDLKRTLKTPKKLNALKKLFSGDPGYLKKIDLEE